MPGYESFESFERRTTEKMKHIIAMYQYVTLFGRPPKPVYKNPFEIPSIDTTIRINY